MAINWTKDYAEIMEDDTKLLLFAKILTSITEFGYITKVGNNDKYTFSIQIDEVDSDKSKEWIKEQIIYKLVKRGLIQKEDKRIHWYSTEETLIFSFWYNAYDM